MIRSVEETKYKVINFVNTPVASAGQFANLTAIPQGVTDITRTGDTLTVRNIHMRMQWTYDSANTGDTPAFCRVVMYQWHPTVDTNVAFPTIATILQNGYSGAPDMTSHYSHDQRFNFHVLWDESFILVPPGGFGATSEVYNSSLVRHFNHVLKKRLNRTVQYVAGSTTNASNQIILIALTNLAVSRAAMAFSCLVEFTDS